MSPWGDGLLGLAPAAGKPQVLAKLSETAERSAWLVGSAAPSCSRLSFALATATAGAGQAVRDGGEISSLPAPIQDRVHQAARILAVLLPLQPQVLAKLSETAEKGLLGGLKGSAGSWDKVVKAYEYNREWPGCSVSALLAWRQACCVCVRESWTRPLVLDRATAVGIHP